QFGMRCLQNKTRHGGGIHAAADHRHEIRNKYQAQPTMLEQSPHGFPFSMSDPEASPYRARASRLPKRRLTGILGENLGGRPLAVERAHRIRTACAPAQLARAILWPYPKTFVDEWA